MKRYRTRALTLMLGLLAGAQLSGCGLLDEDSTTTETVTAPDSTAPSITFTVPVNGDTGTSVTGNLKVVFSEAMDSTTVDNTTISLKNASGTSLPTVVTYAGQIATIDPVDNLSYLTNYSLTFDQSLADAAGNELGSADPVYFTTEASPDTTAPTVSSVSPASGATGVAIGTTVTVTFSETMELDNLTTSTIQVLGADNQTVSGTVTYGSGQQAIFTPTNSLSTGTLYTATVTAGVEDTSGNGLSVDYSWGFTTTEFDNLSSVAEISAGELFSCALFNDRTAKCWGLNNNGALGDGTLVNSSLPVAVKGLIEAERMSSGSRHSCALINDRTVRCWGDNQLGQIGDGSGVSWATPVTVAGLSGGTDLKLEDVRGVSAGAYHTCAILDNYSAACWGSNTSGQLGDNSTTNSGTPVEVFGGFDNFTQISAGGQANSGHTCGLVNDGTVYCWGENNQGQLGDNSTTDNATPELVLGLTNVAQISAGGRHTCAVQDNGSGLCWGDNLYGQLGDNSTGGEDSIMATSIAGTDNFTQISAGYFHTCGVLVNNSVKCWGDNRYGQLGDNSTTTRYVPTAVSGQDNVTAIVAGDYHTCAILSDETMKCWGYNAYGQLGDSTNDRSSVPVQVVE